MRKFFVLMVLMSFMSVCYADNTKIDNAKINNTKINKYPQGTFVKSRSGKIIQSDKNGKKIGEYKLNSERYIIRHEKKFKH